MSKTLLVSRPNAETTPLKATVEDSGAVRVVEGVVAPKVI
jgi:hypothetical protein